MDKFMKTIKKIRWGRVIGIFIVLVFITGVGVVGYFGYNIYKDTAEFDVKKLYSAEPSQILDSNGEVIYRYGSDENGERDNVTYEELPQVLIDAVISAEDSRFFEHDGFDLPRLTKAVVENLLTGFQAGGGSTITQQVIKKSYFPAAERTITRKASELFLAIEASKEVSKEEILTLYLNKIYFGRSLSSIGVGAASRYYFNKDVSQLTLPEAALLAGTLNAPHSYDPYYNLELATSRRDTILDLMLLHGYITEEENKLAKDVKIESTLDHTYKQNSTNTALAYIDIVNSEVLEKTKLDPRETTMIIHTYLDSSMQSDITNIIEEYEFPNEYMQAGASVQDVHTGRIVAVVGGRDYNAFNLNRANLKVQPGSSLKPIVDYGAAFEYLDWSTAHTVTDKAYNQAGYNPVNWDGTIGKKGDMSISSALLNSWNTPAVWAFDSVLKKIGYAGYQDYFEGFKIDMSEDDVNIAYSIGGWSTGISPIGLANMYAAVANGGMAYESHTIDYIEVAGSDEPIKIDEKVQEEASRAISKETSFMIEEVMESYCRSSSYSYMPSSFRSKSGTTNWGANNYGIPVGSGKDSLFASYNPDYSMALWLGYDHSTLKDNPLAMNVWGVLTAKLAARIGEAVVADGVTNSFASAPAGLKKGSAVLGYYPYVAPSANTPSSMILNGWFKPGTLPSETISTTTSIPKLATFTTDLTFLTGKISYSFAPYTPPENPTPQQINATKIFGDILYGIEVHDASTNELLYSTTTKSASGKIDYQPDRDVRISGFYTYSKENSIKSNVIVTTVKVTVPEPPVVVPDPDTDTPTPPVDPDGSTGGDGSNGGNGSTGGDASTGGNGSTGGDTSTGGNGSTGGDGSNGGNGSTGGDASTGGDTSTGGNGSTTE